MSLLPAEKVSYEAMCLVHGFIRTKEPLELSIPVMIIKLVMSFFYIIDLDFWRDNPKEKSIMISHDKQEKIFLVKMKPKHTINIKCHNIIRTNDYDGATRRIYMWTLTAFQIAFYNMWEIGLEGKISGFFGINRNGYAAYHNVKPHVQQSLHISSYFNREDSHRLFNLDHKVFNYDDKIKIKLYFEPSPNNATFDIEFHKNNRLIMEYKSLPIGDDYKLSVNFIKFSSYLNSHSTIFDNNMDWLQESQVKKTKYAGFEINNFKQRIEHVTRKWWI